MEALDFETEPLSKVASARLRKGWRPDGTVSRMLLYTPPALTCSRI
jgi:hypothetical protein